MSLLWLDQLYKTKVMNVTPMITSQYKNALIDYESY
jgi:hypothetical protein